MLAMMAPWSPIMFTAVFGALSPGLAHGEEAQGTALTIALQVTQLNKAGEHADAAELATAGVAREDLADAERVGLAGLAARSFELSYQAGGPLTDLCGAAAVMRLAAPLDTAAGGAVKRAEAEKAEARLERAAGIEWRAVCGLAEESSPPPPGSPEREAPAQAPKTGATSTPREVHAAPTRDPRRMTGIGTLVSGLLLFAPVAGLLVYRGDGREELAGINAATKMRPGTPAEDARVTELDTRYVATTAGAVALGVTGAALVVTGAVLLATGRRANRVAVAPWAGRGIGGLVLRGRF